MANGYAQKMRAFSDEDLIRISSSGDGDGYEVEAMEAARNELSSRNISSEVISETMQIADAHQLRDAQKPAIELSCVEQVIFTILGPLLVVTVGAALILRFCGYTRKSNEAFACIAVSFMLYGLVLVAFDFLSS